MAIKGNAYTKTTWAFEERPVASSKLNIWDDRLEAALELVHFLAAQVWSGTDGVARGATADDLKAVANSPATMGVLVEPGYAFISNTPYKLAAQTPTADVTAPVSNPRIDLVQAGLETWNISVKQGVESATPVAPTADTDSIALAQLYVRTTATSIKDTDDSTNGYIIDARDFL